MRDLLFLLATVGFFGLAALFVAGCDRIVGPDPSPGPADGGDHLDEASPSLAVAGTVGS